MLFCCFAAIFIQIFTVHTQSSFVLFALKRAMSLSSSGGGGGGGGDTPRVEVESAAPPARGAVTVGEKIDEFAAHLVEDFLKLDLQMHRTRYDSVPTPNHFAAPLDSSDTVNNVPVHFLQLNGVRTTLTCRKLDTRHELILRFLWSQRDKMVEQGYTSLALISPGGGDGSAHGKTLEDLGLAGWDARDNGPWRVIFRSR